MPDETKKETVEPEPVGTAIEVISTRAVALKKAGLPTFVIVLITVASIPGVWSAFFDRSSDEAKVKAEVSYALLKAQTEDVIEQIKDNRQEVKALRDMITRMLLQRSGRAEMTDLLLPPAPTLEPMPEPMPPTLNAAVKSTTEGQEAMAGAGLEPSDLNP